MKDYYQIGQFAELTGVSKRTLRNYDKENLLQPAEVGYNNGYRMYTADQVIIVQRILKLQNMGFSLKQIKAVLIDGITREEFLETLKNKEAELRISMDKTTHGLLSVQQYIRWIENGSADKKIEEVYTENLLAEHPTNRSYIVSEQQFTYGEPKFRSYNRDLFFEMIEEKVKNGGSKEKQICLITLDIDRFMQVNDQFGISGGDQVISHLEKSISIIFSDLAEEGFYSRVGGDEFSLFFYESNQEDVHSILNQLLKDIEKSEINTPDGTIKVTLSAGVYWTNHSETHKELHHNATKALLDAKRAGRNQWSGMVCTGVIKKISPA